MPQKLVTYRDTAYLNISRNKDKNGTPKRMIERREGEGERERER